MKYFTRGREALVDVAKVAVRWSGCEAKRLRRAHDRTVGGEAKNRVDARALGLWEGGGIRQDWIKATCLLVNLLRVRR
jgi:hypothetical protein